MDNPLDIRLQHPSQDFSPLIYFIVLIFDRLKPSIRVSEDTVADPDLVSREASNSCNQWRTRERKTVTIADGHIYLWQIKYKSLDWLQTTKRVHSP